MEFDPRNNVIKLCVQAIQMEEHGEREDASRMFLQAWNEARDDFEKFTAEFYVARQQDDIRDRLKWLETSLQFALQINDASVEAAFPALYSKIARCYEELGDTENAEKNYALANSFSGTPSDSGPFYHGTKAGLQVGDLLTPCGRSNYKTDLIMNHIYFTALANGAGLAAALAEGDGPERVYIVEPTGAFENDPNVTDKKFPGDPCKKR